MADPTRFDPRANSVGFLRFALASAVVYWHCVQLGGVGADPVYALSGHLYYTGALGVDGFFALSGYLIAASYVRLKSVSAFAWHRALRILPGYWVCLLVTSFALPVAFGTRPDPGYFVHNSLEPTAYVVHPLAGAVGALGFGEFRNPSDDLPLIRGQETIPGLFEDNSSPGMVNGPLWTLKHEVRLYALVAVLGALGLLNRRVAILLLAVTWLLSFELTRRFDTLSACAAARTSAHFLMGVVFYYWNPPLRARYALAAAAVGVAALAGGFYPLVAPLCMTYSIFWLAAVLPFRTFGRRDYSYGIYIYSFPVQQAVAAVGVHEYGFAAYAGVSFAIILLLAAASWHLVEGPALRLKRLVRAESPRTPGGEEADPPKARPHRRHEPPVPAA
jgi:peptidoglycan/LPS O-acetylase OafA/YrhL